MYGTDLDSDTAVPDRQEKVGPERMEVYLFISSLENKSPAVAAIAAAAFYTKIYI